MLSLNIISTFLALAAVSTAMIVPATLNPRAGKPTGGPASTQITVYSGPYTCTDPQTPPADGSAGKSTVITIAENQCSVVNLPSAGAISAVLTVAPKTGTTGCYVQIYSLSGCGVVAQNQYHGFPYDGVAVGNKVGCVSPPSINYGAVSIVCA